MSNDPLMKLFELVNIGKLARGTYLLGVSTELSYGIVVGDDIANVICSETAPEPRLLLFHPL